MDVMYDYQIFLEQKFGGISRYFHELIRHADSMYIPHISVKYHRNDYIKGIKGLTYADSIQNKPNRFKYLGGGLANKLAGLVYPSTDHANENKTFVLEQLKSVKPDIFHPTYYGDYFVDHIGKTPFILTIYDMIHEKYPEFFKNYTVANRKKKLFSLATHVIAISESTKKDIMELYDVTEEKISVVYLGNSLDRIDGNSPQGPKLPYDYILYIGAREHYKNFLFFINSICKLLKQKPNLNVVCTGRPFSKAEMVYFSSVGLENKVHHKFANDDDLINLYTNAQAFIFPSLYEGFGIPILEAFSCGCPVLCSNSSSLPEVAGDAAIYFEPKSAMQIKNAVQKIISNDSLRTEMITKGRKRLKMFSWDKTAKHTSEVYNKCV